MIRKKRMSKGIAKILSGLLVFGMVAGLVPAVPGQTVHAKAEGESEQNVTAEQSEENATHTHCVCGTNKLVAGNHATHGNIAWTGVSSLNDITGDGYYYLKQSVKLDTTWECNYNINLCLNGNSITCNASDSDVIVIDSGNAFTLTDCQENAGKITHGESNTGTGICNNGTFYMYGGNIVGNTVTGSQYSSEYGKEYKGGGVCNYGTFYMYSGTISGNSVKASANSDEGNYDYGYDYGYGNNRYYNYFNGGGVYNNGTFVMTGGIISDNDADDDYGGGVYNNGSFELTGSAVISKNNARLGGGIYNNSEFRMYAGSIMNNHSGGAGGGVSNEENGTFTMIGGKISGNSTERSGGGVCNYVGTFTMSGDAVISDNSSSDTYGSGGGVYNFNGTFTMENGTISNNKTLYGGGGVYNYAETKHKVQFTMNGGTISDNEAGSLGGGVRNHVNHNYDDANGQSNAIFTMNGGTLTNNRLTGNSVKGGGVYSDDSVVLSGTSSITGNTADNLYLVSEKLVSAAGLTAGANIGVNIQTDSANSTSLIITNDAVTGNYFTSDNSDYEIVINSENNVVMKPKNNAGSNPIPSPEPPTIIEGANGTYTQGGQDGISFRSNDDYNNFQSVLVDGSVIGAENYTTREGSIIVTLTPAYLSTLSAGMHSISIVSTGGTATTNFTVQTASTPTPNPEPKPEPKPEPTPNPEPTPTPAPNPTPEAATPAPATSTPAASTTTAPAAAAPAQVTYDILDGAGSLWTQNTDGSLAIRGSGEISKFREVKVDGVTVDPVNYTVTEGSTIITFKPEYLKSLSAGNHSFELVWTDGTAATNFTVAENADQSAKSPKTGEDFSMALCTALLMVSCVGLAGIFVRRKKSSLR